MRRFSLSQLLFALVALAALAGFGIWYAVDRGVSSELVPILLPAALLELALYFGSGLAAVRERAEEMPPGILALCLTASAPLSWMLYVVPLHEFSPVRFALLIGMGLAVAFWYLVFPRTPLTDAGFLLLLAVPMLLEVFRYLYPSPAPRVPMHALGAMMWYRLGLMSILTMRRMGGIGFGFWPTAADWKVGLRNYFWFLPVGLGLALGLGFAELKPVDPSARSLLLAIATFFGVLWVLAVAEEFFFRGLVQQHLSRVLGNATAGLIVASVIFGAAHLGSGTFPNWRFALLAAIAGLFYGRAYQQTRGIRSAMVTHALVVTTWKTFFR